MYNTAAIVTTQLNHGGKFSGKEFSNSSTTNPGPGEESGKRFKRFRSRHHRVPSADQPSTLKGFLVSSKVIILGVVSLELLAGVCCRPCSLGKWEADI